MNPQKAKSKNIPSATAKLPTPFLLVEEEILHANILRIHAYAHQHGFAVRPHVKTHKSLTIGRMQMEEGAVGITVAKEEEAHIMSAIANKDITVAYPALGDYRTDRLAELSLQHNIRVAADSKYALDELARAAKKHQTVMGILIIFDAGLHRCGLSAPKEVVNLARYAHDHPQLRFDGIQMYLGQLYGDPARDPTRFAEINRDWEKVYQTLCHKGLKPQTVSSGSTPSLFNTHLVSHITEIRVGTAYLNDYFVVKFDHCAIEACAAKVVAQVVSNAVSGQVIIDAGSKALSAKQLLSYETLEMGYILEYPQARIFRLHEEHGWIDVSRCPEPPRLGERLTIIPVNVALCMNLYNHFYLLTCNGKVRREKVHARGCCV
ncbi:MAG: alanine racemase [Desulfobacteraceae bacterium]